MKSDACKRQTLLSANQLARMLGLSRSTIMRLCRSGEIQPIDFPGIGLRISLEMALAYARRARMVCEPLEQLAANLGIDSEWSPVVAVVSASPVKLERTARATIIHVLTPFAAGRAMARPVHAVIFDCHYLSDFRDAVLAAAAMRPCPLIGAVASEDGTPLGIATDMEWRHPVDWSQVLREVVERLRGGG